MTHRFRQFAVAAVLLGLALFALSGRRPLHAETGPGLSSGQTLYVPVYSHIYGGDKEQPLDLTTTLSIRNVDMGRSLSIQTVDYYSTEGALLKRYLSAPVSLGPLASIRFIVKESDKSGGSGANFIVRWAADEPVDPPFVETVMIGTRNQLGISFTGQARVLSSEGAGR